VTSWTLNTNVQGEATSPTFTANGTAGNYMATANVMGLTSEPYFQLTNQA
jgi:hypothetical protein